jgi:hypothetical protein
MSNVVHGGSLPEGTFRREDWLGPDTTGVPSVEIQKQCIAAVRGLWTSHTWEYEIQRVRSAEPFSESRAEAALSVFRVIDVPFDVDRPDTMTVGRAYEESSVNDWDW